ncbi:MAG: alcohol dehydrogenase catalytic domain-containing protein [Burkholderiales bacterium]|nr:MAG: alcohol dehydrogenase catalytic domain-containing protein [Burkholderiales bacterium]
MQLLERPEPAAADREVVLKIEAVGICGSDMHAYHGHDPRRKPGLVLGHEFAGTIVDSRSADHPVGARVTGNPLITCGVCEYCVGGRNNLCANRTMVGMTRPGAFAEFMSIPGASLIDLPGELSPVKAALTEPAATAIHAINRSLPVLNRPLLECRALVLGGGAIGMLAALMIRHHGSRGAVVTEVNPKRRRMIEAHAGAATLDPRTDAPEESAFDFVFDAVGSKATRTAALTAVKPGGVVMHVGLQDWDSEIDMRKLTLAEIALLGAYTYTTADLRAAVRLLHEGAFGDLDWVETRALAEGPQAFSDIAAGNTAAAKVVLLP